MIEKTFSDQPVKNGQRTYDNIQKITASQRDDYTIGCLLNHLYFRNYYKIIATDLNKQQAVDADPKGTQQVSLPGNLNQSENTTMFFIIKEAKKKKHCRFFTRNCESIIHLFCFHIILI